MGNLYAVPQRGTIASDLVSSLREAIGEAEPASCAVSSMGDVLVVRALAVNVEGVRQQLIRAWQALRPVLSLRAPTLPRVWAT